MSVIALESALGEEIVAVEYARQSALVSGDPASLNTILHPDLIHVHSSGNVQNRAEFIGHLAKMGGFVSITRGAYLLRDVGGSILLTGPTVNVVRRLDSGEIAELNGFNAILYTRGEAGNWQVLLSQMTKFQH